MKFNKIKDLREDRDIKQKQLADYLCIQQSTYSDYENGKILIPIEALMKLADYYETSIDFLVGRTDRKEPYPKPEKERADG